MNELEGLPVAYMLRAAVAVDVDLPSEWVVEGISRLVLGWARLFDCATPPLWYYVDQFDKVGQFGRMGVAIFTRRLL